MRILVIEDEARLAQTLAELLHRQGYTADISGDGLSGLDNAASDIYDLVVLDAMLPGMDGFTLLQRLRQEGHTVPVLMLTARSGVEDRVRGLDSGADYYLTKPFGVMELVSCVKAVLRRCRTEQEPVLRAGGIVLHPEERIVTVEGQRVTLTYKEFELLRLFLSHPGMAFTRDQLFNEIWGMDYCGETRTVDMHIRTLRQKLGSCGSMIQTVRNVGYRLEVGA